MTIKAVDSAKLFFTLAMVFFTCIGTANGQETLVVGEAGKALPEVASDPEQLTVVAPSAVDVGQPFPVRLTSTRPVESVTVSWQGGEVLPSISVWNDKQVALALLGTDVLNAKPGESELVVTALVGGEKIVFQRKVQVRDKVYPKQELTLDENMVSPPPEALERAARERKVVKQALNTMSTHRLWSLPLLRPVNGDTSSAYGLRRILNGKPKYPHRGLDFRAPEGTEIRATADGRVILAGDHYYAGKSVYIDHGNGVVSMYFHLSGPKVSEGEQVRRGQVIGLSGTTGRATGPHLHFGVAVQGALVDPKPLLEKRVDQLLAE